ncbi:MAG: O-antigen ligase family protein [Chlamydiia bacterium]|nr:O-antigen ligase family protein [Chlamydiia bacterium]
MITLSTVQRGLVYCFVFFGPLGNLLTPRFLPYAFRFYHFFLLLTPLFFARLEKREWKTIALFLPLFSYCLISALFCHYKEEVHPDSYPLLRAFLFISQCLFMFGASFALKKRDERRRLLTLYLWGFFLSLLVGYFFTIGYYSHFLSFETIHKYSVEAQMGWGLLRFSPGTYPNEYGNVSSFVLSLLLLMYGHRQRFWLLPFLSLTFIASLLTTTRAAYLSFLIALVYLTFTSPPVRKLLTKLSLVFLGILLILKAYSLNFFKIFILGFKAFSFTQGSTGVRFKEWIKGVDDLNSHILFGNGFGANILTHNVYLELLFELGLIGTLVLTVTCILYCIEHSGKLLSLLSSHLAPPPDRFYHQVTLLGLLHVFLFALSNHNMHHHLTWTSFLFLNIFVFQTSDEFSLSSKHRLSPQL